MYKDSKYKGLRGFFVTKMIEKILKFLGKLFQGSSKQGPQGPFFEPESQKIFGGAPRRRNRGLRGLFLNLKPKKFSAALRAAETGASGAF